MRALLLASAWLVACSDHTRPASPDGCGNHATHWESTAQCTCDEGFDWCLDRGVAHDGAVPIRGTDCCSLASEGVELIVDEAIVWPWNRSTLNAHSANEPDGAFGAPGRIWDLETEVRAWEAEGAAFTSAQVLQLVADQYPALLEDPALMPNLTAKLDDGLAAPSSSAMVSDTYEPDPVAAVVSTSSWVWFHVTQQAPGPDPEVGWLALEPLELSALAGGDPVFLPPKADLLGARITVRSIGDR